jgi:RHS repeat-associated protein
VTGSTTYLYDGDGRRVAKANTAVPPAPYKLYWYGPGGEALGETDASGNTLNEYVFLGGRRIAMLPAGGNAILYAEDQLGTSRINTTNTRVVSYDADFYPYGGERVPYIDTCTQNFYKFEGKERDAETGNDDFGARYYSNRFGRWLSADWSNVPVAVPYANLTNPQTLNLYSMVADDPESFSDLDGHLQQSPANSPCSYEQQAQCQQQASQNATQSQNQQAQNNDPTVSPPPSTPDPAGVRTDPALNPSNSNSSTTNTPADQAQAPMESRGQQPKGERRITGKPEFKDKPGKLPKGVRPNPDKPGEYQVKNPHTGNWVDKQPGWSPYAQKVGIGAAIVTGAVIIGHAVAGCFASGACELGLAFAF